MTRTGWLRPVRECQREGVLHYAVCQQSRCPNLLGVEAVISPLLVAMASLLQRASGSPIWRTAQMSNL
jgi:hypothetical protein